MIIDGHAHIFPFLGGANGFPSVQDHLRVLQLYMVGHSQPVRRLRDHNIVTEETLADLPPGSSGATARRWLPCRRARALPVAAPG